MKILIPVEDEKLASLQMGMPRNLHMEDEEEKEASLSKLRSTSQISL